ncbi:protein boule-like isoform X2 [Nothobranchius furzeri]|uniref:protein boule-like isoform X2 n=1 Tax=Nothobranchius furzeri TaxID=105023 RepID=UPI0024041EC7|nr:protein boule-like isoform X2 [Nothobranchius furzeri]
MLPLSSHLSRGTSFLPDVLLPADPANAPSCLTHTPGTIIPNGIFVGRIGDEVDESDLRRVFSQYGEVKEVKIVSHRSGISKGYGFVTFETAEDAMRVLSLRSGIRCRDRILRIARAIKRPQGSGRPRRTHMTPLGPAVPQVSCGTFVMSTSTGFPYTYNNGMAYFHCANVSPDVQFWPPAPNLMLPPSHQHVHQQQYHHFQNFPNPYPWNTVEVPVPPGAVMYPQPSEYLYQPADGPLFLPFGPVWEDAPAEVVDTAGPHGYSRRTPDVQRGDPGMQQVFPSAIVPRH